MQALEVWLRLFFFFRQSFPTSGDPTRWQEMLNEPWQILQSAASSADLIELDDSMTC